MTEPKSSLIAQLLAVADRYCSETGITRQTISKLLLHRSSLLSDMEQGSRDLATGNFERCMQWFSDNWPDSAEWPTDVDRPQAQRPAAIDDDDLGIARSAAG